jgi:GTPase
MPFTVAIVGRPNVGKSTLFNRLTGKRSALVDDTPGVTRDRREGDARLGPLEFRVMDTAGLEEAEDGTLQARMTAQTQEAIKLADAVMLVVDGRAGITPADKHFAGLLRKTRKPVVVVINKAESKRADGASAEAYSLGLGEPVAISAEHGEGLVELYDALAPLAPEEDSEAPREEDGPLQIAIVGRPNAGKSTLLNRILGEERALTSPEAGTTRDSIAVDFDFEGTKLRLIDTAGLRRKANITGKIEKLAVADALSAVQYAQVVIVVIDANQPLEKQDNTIAALVEQEGRAIVIAANKWDTVEDKPAYLKAIRQRLDNVLAQVKGVPVVPISAATGYNIDKLFKELFKAYTVWNRTVGTGALNRWLTRALEKHMPPLINGRRLKIRYMTQKSARPPTFILFANLSEIPDHYLRYLMQSMREEFDLPGVPIRFKIRKSKNPYENK